MSFLQAPPGFVALFCFIVFCQIPVNPWAPKRLTTTQCKTSVTQRCLFQDVKKDTLKQFWIKRKIIKIHLGTHARGPGQHCCQQCLSTACTQLTGLPRDPPELLTKMLSRVLAVYPAGTASACHLSTWEAEAEDPYESEASLVDLATFRPTKATQQEETLNTSAPNPNQNNKEHCKLFLSKFFSFELRFHYGGWLGIHDPPSSALCAKTAGTTPAGFRVNT